MNHNSSKTRSMFLGLGLGLAATMTAGATPSMPASGSLQSANQVSERLAALREIGAAGKLESSSGDTLLAATCSGTCNANGSGSYSQEPGCTYTQTCGGKA